MFTNWTSLLEQQWQAHHLQKALGPRHWHGANIEIDVEEIGGSTSISLDDRDLVWFSSVHSFVGTVVKSLPARAGDAGDVGLIPGLGKSSGEEMATHSSILTWKNAMDREVWQAAVHGVTKSWTGLSDWAHTHIPLLVSRTGKVISFNHSLRVKHHWAAQRTLNSWGQHFRLSACAIFGWNVVSEKSHVSSSGTLTMWRRSLTCWQSSALTWASLCFRMLFKDIVAREAGFQLIPLWWMNTPPHPPTLLQWWIHRMASFRNGFWCFLGLRLWSTLSCCSVLFIHSFIWNSQRPSGLVGAFRICWFSVRLMSWSRALPLHMLIIRLHWQLGGFVGGPWERWIICGCLLCLGDISVRACVWQSSSGICGLWHVVRASL